VIHPDLLALSPAVSTALEHGRPVVGLETTILSFGLPRPLNEEVAVACENAVSELGAVPASLALLDGRVRVGLSRDEIRHFCSGDPQIRKVNLQNFSTALAEKVPGALTVAASVKACAAVGIRVFATGGIGGVHRDYAHSPDVSSDMRALARFPVAVVCAGMKSILDVSATLELLETLGVPVVGYGTPTFPVFYTTDSDHELECVVRDVGSLARCVQTHFRVSDTGIVVAAPIPPTDSIPRERLEAWAAEALALAERRGIRGKCLTPFLLEQLERLSGGQTLSANRALILNNVQLAARLSVSLCDEA
jgi:pseudouridine-5'-phosphate glycosidase